MNSLMKERDQQLENRADGVRSSGTAEYRWLRVAIPSRVELNPPRRRSSRFPFASLARCVFDSRGCLCAPGKNESGNALEFVRVEPGAVFMTLIDDHTRTSAKVAARHHRVTGRTAPVLDAIRTGIPTVDARRRRLAGFRAGSSHSGRPIHERIEYVLRRPDAVAFGAFLNDERADLTRGHPSFAARTAEFRGVVENRLGVEARPTGEAKARVIQIARHAFRTDGAPTTRCGNDARLAIVADLITLSRDRAASATSLDPGIDAHERGRLEGRATATIERTPEHPRGDVILRMAIWAGDQLHSEVIGGPDATLDRSPTATRRQLRREGVPPREDLKGSEGGKDRAARECAPNDGSNSEPSPPDSP